MLRYQPSQEFTCVNVLATNIVGIGVKSVRSYKKKRKGCETFQAREADLTDSKEINNVSLP
jgi:hypothetical protein